MNILNNLSIEYTINLITYGTTLFISITTSIIRVLPKVTKWRNICEIISQRKDYKISVNVTKEITGKHWILAVNTNYIYGDKLWVFALIYLSNDINI